MPPIQLGHMSVMLRPSCGIICDLKKMNQSNSIRNGKMLVVNNNNFVGREDKRDGSEKDVQSLKWIFEKFGFSIDTCIDQTEEGIKQAISQFKSCVLEGQETCDMIVVAIMSHGTGNSFLSADGHPIPMEYILEYVQYIEII